MNGSKAHMTGHATKTMCTNEVNISIKMYQQMNTDLDDR